MEIPERIDHYRLEEKLGEGGMGVVYRAWDEDLERWVAIKFIHGERRQSVARQKRFRREALTVARLVHPAIVQVHQKLRFDEGEGIVMELVEGESLARLLAAGTLDAEAALPLALEVAEGLAYAHDEGFVHRDLKADNVMVTRTGHAKILDFGLAKGLEASTLSEEGSVLGTLHTMSPEQAQGLEVDHRTDLFSLGVLLYEALTGTSPFRAASAREVMGRVIHHHPPLVTELNPAVPQKLSGLVERLLAKHPAGRPQSAAEVAVALARCAGTRSRLSLEGAVSGRVEPSPEAVLRAAPTIAARPPERDSPAEDATTESVVDPSTAFTRPGRRMLFAALVLFGLIATLIGLPSLVDRERAVLVVADFENRTGSEEMEWLGVAIARSLTENLLVDDQLRRPARRPERLRSPIERENRERLRQGYGADVLIDGSYRRVGNQVEVSFILQSAQSDDVMKEEKRTVPDEQIFVLVRTVALDFRRALGMDEMSAQAEQDSRALFPTRFETARLYSQALMWRLSDPWAARDRLEETLELEPENPLLHDALALVLEDLGYAARAQEASLRAEEHSDRLPRRRRLEMKAHYSESVDSWDEAIRIHKQLCEEFPNEIGVCARLAQALIGEEKFDEALELLGELGVRSTAAVEKALIDVATARVQIDLGEHELARETAARAAVRAKSTRATYLEARARFVQGDALHWLGRHEESLKALDQALNLFDRSGSRQGVLDSANRIAIVYAEQGEYREAAEKFERYREIYRERGDRFTEGLLNVNLANVWSEQGRLAEAETLLENALATLEEFEARTEAATAVLNLGIVWQELGELAKAQTSYEKSLATFEAVNDEQNIANVSVNLAEVFFWTGELDKAQELLDAAIEIHASRESSWLAYDNLRLGETLAARGHSEEARQSFEKALALAKEHGSEADRAEIELGYARFELERENLEAARRRARTAEEYFLNEEDHDNVALARIVRARTYLASRTPDLRRAQELYNDVEIGAVNPESVQVPIELRLLEARIAASSPGRSEEAAAVFEEVAEDVAERGLVPYAFEASLALGELEIEPGASAEGRARLETLVAEARRHGFEEVARQAEAFLGR